MPMSTLEALCRVYKITCSAKYGAVEVPEGWPSGTHPYKVTLRFDGRSLTVPFYMGPAAEREPTAADVLACLCRDVYAGEQSFEDFCSDMGLDLDSRKAEQTWQQCVKLAPKVRRFLSGSFDKVAGAEH